MPCQECGCLMILVDETEVPISGDEWIVETTYECTGCGNQMVVLDEG